MTPEQFTYWLQGYTEISGAAPTESQWQVIKDHLDLIFKKETPDRTENKFARMPLPEEVAPFIMPPFTPNRNEILC